MFCSKRNYFEAMRLIHSKKVEDNIENDLLKILDKKPEYPEFDTDTVARLNQEALVSHRAAGYLKGRGITKESVEKYKIGYSEKQDMITIPIYSPDGICVGMVGRSIEGKEFKNTPGLPKSRILFNLHRARKHDTVYVVESSFDAIRLDQNGIPAVATLGANVSRNQIELLTKYFNNAIVVGDNDDAGKGMQQKILDRLGSRATLINIPSRFKDIGDMTDDDIQKLNEKLSDPLFALL